MLDSYYGYTVNGSLYFLDNKEGIVVVSLVHKNSKQGLKQRFLIIGEVFFYTKAKLRAKGLELFRE